MKSTVTKYGMMIIAAVLFVAAASAGVAGAGLTLGESFDSDVSQTVLIKIDTDVLSISDLDHRGIIYDYGSLLPGTYAIRIPAGYTQEQAIAYYESIPGVIYAEPNGKVSATTASSPQQTSQSPAPFAGLVAGFGIATLLGYLKRRENNP